MDGNPRRNPPPWDLMLIGDVWEEDHSRNSIQCERYKFTTVDKVFSGIGLFFTHFCDSFSSNLS